MGRWTHTVSPRIICFNSYQLRLMEEEDRGPSEGFGSFNSYQLRLMV